MLPVLSVDFNDRPLTAYAHENARPGDWVILSDNDPTVGDYVGQVVEVVPAEMSGVPIARCEVPRHVYLWYDDIRIPPGPEGRWAWARTNAEAIQVLETGRVSAASLDHDMGLDGYDPFGPPDPELIVVDHDWPEEDGTKLAEWMVATGNVPEQVLIHSHNPVGAKRMSDILLSHEPKPAVVVGAYRA